MENERIYYAALRAMFFEELFEHAEGTQKFNNENRNIDIDERERKCGGSICE